MTISELEKKIDKAGLDKTRINIGKNPTYDGQYNLYMRSDGKFATFYGEHGFPSDQRLFDTEEEAANAFWADLEYHMLRPVVPHPTFTKWVKSAIKRFKDWRNR